MAQNFLDSIKVADILDKKEVFYVNADASARSVLELLVLKNLYAAPVYEESKPLGLVNLCSIVKAIVQLCEDKAGIARTETPSAKIEKLSKYHFSTEEIKGITAEFDKIPVKGLISVSFTPRSTSTPLKEIISDLAKNDRASIVDESGKVIAVLSQAVVVKFLIKNMNKLGPVVSEKLENLKIISSPVHTVNVRTPTIISFARMIEEGFSSMGIVDEDRQVVGIISFKDIKGCSHDFRALFHATEDYVNSIRREDFRDVIPTVNCKSTDTLQKALAKLDAVGVHRLFVSSENDRGHHFSGIVTLADVLTVFVR